MRAIICSRPCDLGQKDSPCILITEVGKPFRCPLGLKTQKNMKWKYLEICFRWLRGEILNLLSEDERKKFYKIYSLLEFMESEEETDKMLKSKASNILIEYWITIIIDYLAKSSIAPPDKGNWYKENLEKCGWL